MKSSSLYIALQHGIKSPREYRDMLIHDWNIPSAISENLTCFFKRKCTSKFLFDHLNNGELRVGGRNYAIIWLSKPAAVNKIGEAAISFRYCSMLDCGYAIVKINDENRNIEDLFIEEPIKHEQIRPKGKSIFNQLVKFYKDDIKS